MPDVSLPSIPTAPPAAADKVLGVKAGVTRQLDAGPSFGQLSAAGGSALAGYVAGGSGSIARTVQSKLRDTISVKDYGAVGDNVADDTAAFQAAIDYCEGLGGGTVCIPVGKYYVASVLNMKTSVRVIGAGRGYNSGGTEIHAGANLFRFNGQLNCAIEHLLIFGRNSQTGSALFFDTGNTSNLYVSNILVRNMHSAIYCESKSLITVAKFHFCKFIYNKNWHVELEPNAIWNCVTFGNCEFEAQYNTAKAGLFKHASGTLGYTYFNDCLFQASASVIAVDLGSSCYAAFSNCLFYDNAAPTAPVSAAVADGCSIKISNGTGQVSLRNCSLGGPGPGATNFHHIIKDSGRVPLLIEDCAIRMGTDVVNLVNTSHMSAVSVKNCIFTGSPIEAEYDMLSSAGFDAVSVNNIRATSRTSAISDVVKTLKTTDAAFTTIQGGPYVVKASTSYLYSAEITARSPDGAVFYANIVRRLFSVASDKTITEMGSMDQMPITSGSTLAIQFILPASGSASAGISLQVRGIAATTVNWACHMNILPVGAAAGFYP